MPMYDWQDSVSGKKAVVIRTADEFEVPPDREEADELTDEEFAAANWDRIIHAPSVARGPGWGGGKGYW